MNNENTLKMEKIFCEIADKIYNSGEEIDSSILSALCNIISNKKNDTFVLNESIEENEDLKKKADNDPNYKYYVQYTS